MATSIYFGGKTRKLPGTYSTVVSGIKTETAISTYGNVLLIDAGAGKGFNAAVGLRGHGKETILALEQDEANTVIRGGALKPVIEALFKPATGVPGVSTLYLLKAAETTPASIASFSLFGGAITATKVKTKDEGTVCNTVVDNIGTVEDPNEVLRQGYLFKSLYNADEKKAFVEIWLGTYQGTNSKGYQIGVKRENSGPTLVFRSRRCSTPKQLVEVLSNSSEFNSILSVEGLTAAADTFTSTDGEVLKFTGATETYMDNITEVFGYLHDIDYSYAMVLEENGTQNFATSLYDFIKDEAKDIKQMITYDGVFDAAIALASQYNDDAVIVASGVVKKTSNSSPDGFIVHDPMVSAAYVVGRICGLSPEISATMKSIGIDGMDVEPSTTNLEDMLDGGVLCPYYDSDLGYYCLSQAVNSLQKNSNFINEDCTTYSIQAKRIIAQVMKNLQQRAKIEFWGGETGVNRGTLSDAYLRAWTKGKLESLTVSQDKTENNYLLTYEVTKIETNEDNKFVYFTFTVNGEVSKVFFTGVVLG